ncbi:hypothetical protein MN608_11079 [Microdochium nivale]|nr:hypothetical protein MN608_11079 [Microdochium nivale]
MRRGLPPLAAKPSVPATAAPAPSSTTAHTRPSQNQHHTDQEWESLRPVITNLFFVDKLNIDDILLALEREHGFKTSNRSLKDRLKQWGIKRNLRKDDMKILAMKEDQRIAQGKSTAFKLGGSEINPERLATFRKRHAKDFGPAPPPDAPTPEGIEYFTPRDLGPEDSAEQNRIETPAPAPTGVVHLSQREDQSAGYDIMSETVEGTTEQKRGLDPSDLQSSQLLLHRDKRQRLELAYGTHSSPLSELTDGFFAQFTEGLFVQTPTDERFQPFNTMPDALSRLYSLFADSYAPGPISKQSVIKDMREFLVTSSRKMDRPRHLHANDPAFGLCHHHQTDSRLLQFVNAFGRSRLILDHSSIQRKHRVAKTRTIEQILTIDEITLEEGQIRLQTLVTTTHVLDLSKAPSIRTNRVLRFLPSRHRTEPASEPFRMLAASVLEHNGTSISSLSVNMIRPASAPVFQTVRNGDLKGLKSLLASGQASIRDQDEFQASLLMYAYDQPEICRYLINAGLNLDHQACAKGVTRFKSKEWRSALSMQLANQWLPSGELDLVVQCRRMLLDAGADPTLPDSDGFTVLSHTLIHGTKLSVRTLWGPSLAGLWVYLSDYNVFEHAFHNTHSLVITEFIRLGADPRMPDRKGRTALHYACKSARTRQYTNEPISENDFVEVIRLLLAAGVDATLRDNQGMTAPDLAYYGSKIWCFYGTSSGDILDVALVRSGLDIETFRRSAGIARKPRYGRFYTRAHFELLWKDMEHLCPYWDDQPWPADLPVFMYPSSSDDESSDEEDDSSDEDDDSSDEDDEYFDSHGSRSSGHGDAESAATFQQRPSQSPRLPSMLAEIEDTDCTSDSEVLVLRDAVPESLVMEDEEQLDFNFAGPT